MKHVVAIILKSIIVVVILEIYMLLATALVFWQALVLALVVTVAAYVLGDIVILARSNNTIATICDIVLAFLVIFLFRYASGYAGISIVDAIVCAVLIGIAEWFFHKYMAAKVLEDHRD
jgi:hypothetical protein